jgi:hypothetical protein
VDIPDASQGVDLDTVEDLRRLQERPEL